MCRGGGGGGNLLYLLCLISNTMPQLEQSSLQPSTYLQHRHLLQTTSYNHRLRLHLLISRKRKHRQQQARNPPPPLDGGLRSQKGLRPFNPLQRLGPLRSHKNRHGFVPFLTNVFVTMVLKTLIICYFPAPFSLFKEQPLELVYLKFCKNTILITRSTTCDCIYMVIGQSILPIIENLFCRQLHLSKTLGASWCRCLLYRHTTVSITYLTFGVCHNLSSFIFIALFMFCV